MRLWPTFNHFPQPPPPPPRAINLSAHLLRFASCQAVVLRITDDIYIEMYASRDVPVRLGALVSKLSGFGRLGIL